MKSLIFGGSGAIGRTVAWDLARDAEVESVGLVGRRRESLERTRQWIGSKKLVLHAVDIQDRDAVLRLMERYDVGVLALPDRRTSYKVVEYAVGAGLHIVDMLEEYHRYPDAFETEGLELPAGKTLEEYGDWLHREAVRNGVTFLDGMGFAPGLSNVALGEAIRRMERPEKAVARVGGIPSAAAAARHPLRYMITWAFEHVLREYVIRLQVIRNGTRVEVAAGSDLETFRFDEFGHDVELQCAVTPGMPSFLYTFPELREFAEKTVRWPGHWQGVQTLKECGLLDLEPIEFQGRPIVPREFLVELLTPRLEPRPGETDVSVMYNTLEGEHEGQGVRVEQLLWDEGEPQHGITSMMRATGYPVAIGARLLARGKIQQQGIVAPEEGITGDLYREFMTELEARGIVMRERSIVAAA